MLTQQGQFSRKRSPFLKRLASDRSGNVLAITAAAILPMIGVVGGAIDTSRLYLVKSRVQAACDSAVLAGRKAMTTNIYTRPARDRANSMFNFNFQDADYGTTGTSFTSSADNEGKVTGVATTDVPMTLMQIFGFDDKNLSVTCSADIQVPNIDIVFVLDVTGSMNWSVNGKNTNPSEKNSRLYALKQAAKNFAATMETALAGNTRSQVRYGFVPYSQTVNVSDLFRQDPDPEAGQLPLSHLANSMMAESRVANFHTPVETYVIDPNSTPLRYDQTFDFEENDTRDPFRGITGGDSKMSNLDCDHYSGNLSMDIGGKQVTLYPEPNWPGAGEGVRHLFKADGSNQWREQFPGNADGFMLMSFERISKKWNDNNGGDAKKFEVCTRRVTQTHIIKTTRYKFTNWTYRPVEYDVSDFKNSDELSYISEIDKDYLVDTHSSYDPVELRQLANQNGLTSRSTTWNRCIEERDTTAATNFAPIPAAARDLNFIEGGTSDPMRWRTVLDSLTYDRGRPAHVNATNAIGSVNHSCPPVSIRNLNKMARNEFDAYVDSLEAVGGTYHDIGMIWGLRLISPTGMFANRNLTGLNGGQISRHIIFLTDGEPAPEDWTYSAYGVERMSQRVRGGSGISQRRRHNLRFQALCDAQRGLVSIWTIGFGTTIKGKSEWENADTGNLTTCADPGRAFEANNSAELHTAFQNIAREVADLRLVE